MALLLVTSSDSDYAELANRIERGEEVLRVPIFHYQNDLGWRCVPYMIKR